MQPSPGDAYSSIPVAALATLTCPEGSPTARFHRAKLPVANPNYQALAEHPRRPRHGIQRDRHIMRIQQAIQLRPAGLKVSRHRLFGLLLLLHFLRELPCQHSFDRDSFHFLPNAFLFQEIIEARSAMVESDLLLYLLHGSPLSCFFLLARASLKSSAGVRRVFLMNPCSSTIRPSLS